MKKSIKALTLGLLTVSMLAGCNKQAPDPTWSDEVKEMMTQNLHGVVLPYLSLSNMEATVKEGMINVVADELDGSAMAAYAEKFTVEEGWVNMLESNSTSSSVFLGEEAAYPDHYSFEKEVMVPGEKEGEQVKRFVDVSFGNQGEEFVAQAGDPYEYEFPAYDIALDIYYMTGNAAFLPEPEFGVDAYAILPETEVTPNFYFTKNADVDHPADSYKQTLLKDEENEFYVVDGEEEHSYYAYDETQSFTVQFGESDGELMLYVDNYTDWPSMALDNLLKKHFGDELQDSVPACASDKFKVVYAYDDEISVKLEVLLPDVLTIEAAEEAYDALLRDEEVGYETADLGGHDGYRSKNSELFIYFTDYSKDEEKPYTDRFVINIVSPAIAVYPQDKVNAFRTEYGVETEIPAYPGEAFFTFDDSYKTEYDVVVISVYGAGTDFSSYSELLRNSGFKTTSSSEGVETLRPEAKPDCQIRLRADEDIDGFEIYIWGIEAYDSFPVEKLAAEYSVEKSIFPMPETMEGADYWTYSSIYENELVVVTGYFDTADHATAGVNALSAAYEADTANWLMVSEGSFANVANSEFTVSISVDSQDTKQITVTFNKVIHYTSLPAVKLFSRVGLNLPPAYVPYFLPTPSFEANDWIIQSPYSNQSLAVTEFETAEEAAAAVTAYNAQIEATETYTFNSDRGYWEYEGSNFTLVVMVTSSDNSFIVIVAIF